MINQLFKWLDASTCNVMAVDTIEQELINAGFTPLRQQDAWALAPGARHYIIQNGTAIFAFIAGEDAPAQAGFHIISAHSDSPCLKIKPNAEIWCEGGVLKLNVEKYGGGIQYTWFDRPLSISGRVALRSDNPLRPRMQTIDLTEPVATIPHLAIHFNRAVNEGNPISIQRDMLPVAGVFTEQERENFKHKGGFIRAIIAKTFDLDPTDILDYELCLYPLDNACRIGVNGELFQSGRIDDLSMSFAALRAMLDSAEKKTASTRIMAIFDNEETGSGTKQGAGSPVLQQIMERISRAYGGGHEDYCRAVANSFMISADDAHAWHPNYDGKYDPTNHALMGHGPAIKINANCKYMTDADSAAVFTSLCKDVNVPVQYFVNHSDVLGGSTLGNILTSQIPLRGVDMGAPIWAMHSARETASCSDHENIVKVFTHFFNL